MLKHGMMRNYYINCVHFLINSSFLVSEGMMKLVAITLGILNPTVVLVILHRWSGKIRISWDAALTSTQTSKYTQYATTIHQESGVERIRETCFQRAEFKLQNKTKFRSLITLSIYMEIDSPNQYFKFHIFQQTTFESFLKNLDK